jgi:hypothetical protein
MHLKDWRVKITLYFASIPTNPIPTRVNKQNDAGTAQLTLRVLNFSLTYDSILSKCYICVAYICMSGDGRESSYEGLFGGQDGLRGG